MTPEQIQQFKDGGKLMIELAEAAEHREYLVKNATSVQEAHNRYVTSLEDRLRDARNVIATQEAKLESLNHEKDLSQYEAKIDGQGIEYWHSIATSALQTNDHLISRQRELRRECDDHKKRNDALKSTLKAKERVNADLEQQLAIARGGTPMRYKVDGEEVSEAFFENWEKTHPNRLIYQDRDGWREGETVHISTP